MNLETREMDTVGPSPSGINRVNDEALQLLSVGLGSVNCGSHWSLPAISLSEAFKNCRGGSPSEIADSLFKIRNDHSMTASEPPDKDDIPSFLRGGFLRDRETLQSRLQADRIADLHFDSAAKALREGDFESMTKILSKVRKEHGERAHDNLFQLLGKRCDVVAYEVVNGSMRIKFEPKDGKEPLSHGESRLKCIEIGADGKVKKATEQIIHPLGGPIRQIKQDSKDVVRELIEHLKPKSKK